MRGLGTVLGWHQAAHIRDESEGAIFPSNPMARPNVATSQLGQPTTSSPPKARRFNDACAWAKVDGATGESGQFLQTAEVTGRKS